MSDFISQYTKRAVRGAAILTNSYVSATVQVDPMSPNAGANQDLSPFNQLIVLVQFTIGSLTDGRVKIEFSPDGTTWYQETTSSVAAGVETDSVLEHAFTASGNYRLAIPLLDRFVRISAKGTGTVTSSSMAIDVVAGVTP